MPARHYSCILGLSHANYALFPWFIIIKGFWRWIPNPIQITKFISNTINPQNLPNCFYLVGTFIRFLNNSLSNLCPWRTLRWIFSGFLWWGAHFSIYDKRKDVIFWWLPKTFQIKESQVHTGARSLSKSLPYPLQERDFYWSDWLRICWSECTSLFLLLCKVIDCYAVAQFQNSVHAWDTGNKRSVSYRESHWVWIARTTKCPWTIQLLVSITTIRRNNFNKRTTLHPWSQVTVAQGDEISSYPGHMAVTNKKLHSSAQQKEFMAFV